MSGAHIGVLALQGDVREHLAALSAVGADPVPVRRRSELDAVDALLIPGGESTTISHLLRELELADPLRARLAEGMPAETMVAAAAPGSSTACCSATNAP